jgi:uncharacterized protein YbdZ (MbtH family)
MMDKHDDENVMNYKVVMNHEEQYSIWLDYKETPPGWKDMGKTGSKAECLAYIREVWTDMRPLSLRKKMASRNEISPDPDSFPIADSTLVHETRLADRLCEGNHPVEVGLRPEKTVKQFRKAIDSNYVHVRFTATRGGTELGFRLDESSSDFSAADFDNSKGTVHLEGNLTLDQKKVRCIADIDLSTLCGTGRLVKIEAATVA